MSFSELREITPRSLFNKLHGFRRLQRDEWERARLMVFYTLLPNIPEEQRETIRPSDIMPMPWDEETLGKAMEGIKEKAARLKKERDAVFAEIDKSRDGAAG